jgi:hypothetical protein
MPTVPTWPDTLPVPRRDGYNIKPVPSYARTAMDSGTSRQRRRFVTTPTNLTITLRMTTAELGIYETFFEEAIFGGSAWFLMPIYNGQGKAMVQVRQTDTHSETPVTDSDLWDVSFPVESLSMPVALSG